MLTLESGPARLVVAPEKGGRIVALKVDGLDLLVTQDVDGHNFGCFPMAPWAGRVRHGRFDFEARRYQLPLNNPPHAIHGTARDHPWQEDGEGVISASLGPPWPFGGRVVQCFELAPNALHLTMEVARGRRFDARLVRVASVVESQRGAGRAAHGGTGRRCHVRARRGRDPDR